MDVSGVGVISIVSMGFVVGQMKFFNQTGTCLVLLDLLGANLQD